MPKLEKFNKPIVFALAITFVVVGMVSLMGVVFYHLRWTGPLGLVKGGVVQGGAYQ